MNKKYFFSYGVRVQHLNKGRAFNKQLSLLTRGQAEFGYKLLGVYLFSGLSVNYFMYRDTPFRRGIELAGGKINHLNYQTWVAYILGIQW